MIPVDFYTELLQSNKFCESLGRLLLLSGKLESILKEIITSAKLTKNYTLERFTLGALIKICQENNLVSNEINDALSFALSRRNYLTHNLYPLFNEEVGISLLPRENLSPEDAGGYFTRCVNDLISDIEFIITHLNYFHEP
jgi:hypothetical protein